MKKALLFGLFLALGGCASQSCDRVWSDSCRAERLLYQNDLMQAKILISVGNEDGYELAQALLDRSARLDRRGETEFYQALLLIRQGPEPSEVLQLLEQLLQVDGGSLGSLWPMMMMLRLLFLYHTFTACHCC